ncbi:MAG TPA: TetR/AcrR family transcriptional regulator, partial [Acidimicrobiia bacterium]|nr:TetR/AcrR family transcriptional regulator [Acidimicrobiia bacterium]
VQGYRSPAMVLTPWGDAAELRKRKLRKGRGTPREEVERNHRERLFAAMVATMAEQGYEATTVADLVNLSGVSRSAFYRHFGDKQECFLAAIEALVDPALETAEAGLEPPGDTELAKQAFETLIRQIVEQPAASKMCFVEIYAAAPAGVALVDRTIDAFEGLVKQMLDQMPGHEGMPPEIVRALIGGVQKVIHKRLYRGQEDELLELAPQLWDWLLSYPPPPGPLKARLRSRKTPSFEERQAVSSPPERILRALAAVVSEKGYHETTVADIVERAKTSTRTFYEHFESKEDAMVAALDSGASQMLAAAMPAYRREHEWQRAIQATQEAMFTFGVQEPEYARLGAVEIFGAGTRALEQRETVTEGMELLLAKGYELKPDAPPITAEAIGGALYALFYDFVRQRGPERLAEIVPPVVYVTLAPFLGAEEAFELATQ